MRRPPSSLSLRRLLTVGLGVGLSLLSCGREVTGPSGTQYARGLSFIAEFPGSFASGFASVEQGAGSVVSFTRVRVFFRRLDGVMAFDRVVDFPANQQEISLSFDVPLSENAGATGEELDLFVRYINAGGDTVFAGGPVTVLARPSQSGPPPTPASVPLTYTGPGASAIGIVVSPDTITLLSGLDFSLTAAARDAQNALVLDAPVVWTALDASKLSIPSMGAGVGSTLPARGWGRVRVALAAGGAADTAYLNILPRASALAVVGGAAQTATIASTLPNPVRIRVDATDGLPMAGVAVRFAVTAGGGSVSADSAVSDALGVVSVGWTLGAVAGTQTLTATMGISATATINATAQAAALPSLVVTQQPAADSAGSLLAPIIAEVRDGTNTLVPSYSDSVTIAIAAGPASSVLLGRTKVRAVGGVVTFDSLALTRRGSYTFALSGPGMIGTTSASVSIASAVPSTMVLVSGGGQVGAPSSVLADSIIVRVNDVFGNAVPSVTVAPVELLFGTVSPTSASTDTTGHAAFRWTLGAATGPQLLELEVVGRAVNMVSVTANPSNSTVVGTEVNPALDTLNSIGESTQLTAIARDASANQVSGSFTWSSVSPAVATVDSTGRVTAVANGTTWIHAIELGGTRDSAQIVVLQQLVSVQVTPGNRQLYLGGSFNFDAQAIDGLGVPMATQPTFVWSTQSSAIALVDSVGVVSTVGLGSTQVRATAGAVTGVANVSVVTPITRIAVVRDSIGFTVTDTFTLVALQRARSYRAVAYDTLDAVMTGITFTWESANPSVAQLDSTGTVTARARAQANGATSIRASAQGVTGQASLRVQQVLASIDLDPNAATIAPIGNTLLTARGRDPDGFFLPSLTGVAYLSLNTGIATVNATSGLVTGVANGTALITASKGGILADTVTITVGGAVPAIISFGRDSLAIGRSASQSIPIYLSRPHVSPLTVNLAVADTFAFFSTASITIPAGSTSGNATLNGRNAGSTQLYATDGSAAGYAGDTARLAVQANVRFSTGSYSLLATNSTSTQVLLSDPSPAGGTFVTYAYGTPGRAEISPDPAFIPVGQLSANVVITGLAGGSTTVIPVATGVNGQQSTVTVSAAVLDVPQTVQRMALGTYRTDQYVQVGAYVTQGIPVTLTSVDSAVALVDATASIPIGSYYSYFTVRGIGLGSTWVRATAPGFAPDSFQVLVSSPRLDGCCDASRQTTSPNASLSVSVRDSVGSTAPRLAPLVVQVSSSDTSIVRLLTATATIAANQSSVGSIQYAVGGNIGSAWIYFTSAGHASDSVRITVVGPKLSFSSTAARVGVGQRNASTYVYLPNNTPTARVVYLTNSNPSALQLPDSVVIPAGSYYIYFNVDGLTAGTASLTATTAGHEPDTMSVIVSSPQLALSGGGTVDDYRAPFNISVGVRDSVGGAYARVASLSVTLVSRDTTVVRVTPTAIVAAGQNATSSPLVTVEGPGTTWIVSTAAGHASDSVSYTVRVPKLSLSFATYTLGRRQFSGESSLYVSVPNNVTDTLPVTLTQSNPSADSIPNRSPNIPTGIYYRYFSTIGLVPGIDTVIASAPGYLPDTAVIRVTSVRFSVGGLPGTRTTTSPPSGFSVTAVDSLGTSHPLTDTVVVSVVSSNPAVLQPVQTSYRILPGQTSVSPQVAFVGPGSASITVSDSLGSGYGSGATNSVTVTGPSLALNNGAPRLGMRQNQGGTSSYVSVQNNIVGTPLVVRLVSTDPSVATVPDSVVIPVGTYYAYFNVTAKDVIGTVQIQATAVGYSPASVSQEVTAPKFAISTAANVRTTQLPQAINVYATDANGTAHPTNEAVVVTLASSSTAIGTIDSASVTIAAGTSSNSSARFLPSSPGTTQLSATDARTESYRYATATQNVSVSTPQVNFSWSSAFSLGVGQYTESYYVQVPDTRVSPLIVSIARAANRVAIADTVTINAGIYYRYVRISGLSVGTDSLVATAPGHVASAERMVNVGLGRVDGISGWPTTLSADSVQVTLYTRGPESTINFVTAPTTFTLGVVGNLQFVSGGAASAVISNVTVPANASSVAFWVKRLPGGGPATVTISATGYTNYVSTVTVSP